MSTGRSFSHLSLQIGSGFAVRCSTYPDTTPILSIDAGGGSFSITPRGEDVTDDALTFSRDLLHKVQDFAAEVERMHAAQASITPAAGDSAASTKAESSKAA